MLGGANGLKIEAVITNMDAPLGRSVGNGLEIIEAILTFKGRGPKDLEELSVLLAAKMVRLAGIARTDKAAEKRVREAITSGAGLEMFRKMIIQQGGDPRVIDNPNMLTAGAKTELLSSDREGFVSRIDAELVGRAAMRLGAGRERAEARIDPAVGVMIAANLGSRIAIGTPLFIVLHRDGNQLPEALRMLREAVTIADAPPEFAPLVIEVIA